MDANSGFVTFFQILIGIIVIPNVILNLYIMAFGYKDNEIIIQFLLISEFFFLLEIIQNFFTSYSDPEHYDTIDSIKLIATRYILNGSFIVHALSFFPWSIALPNDTLEEE